MLKYSSILYLLLCIMLSTSLSSQSITDSLGQELLITATKVPTPVKQNSKSILVIDSVMIAQAGVSDLSQLLDRQAGIRVNGALSNPGVNKSIFIQGGGAEDVLFLIDGIPLNDPSAIGGAFDIRNLSLAGIQRIEILKGVQSTLYGSNAVSGVINIITNSDKAEGLKLSGQAEFASLNTQSQQLNLSYGIGKTTFNLSGSNKTSDGQSEALNQNPETSSFDRDGFSRRNLNIYLEHELSDAITIRPFYRNNRFNGQFDAGSFTDSGDRFESNYFSIGGQGIWKGKGHELRALGSFTDTDRTFITSFGTSDFDGAHYTFDIFDRINFGANSSLTVGFNWQEFGVTDATAVVTDPIESIWSPYALYDIQLNQLNLAVGLRYNAHSQFGNNTTYELSGSYFITDGLKGFASYSTGFTAPLLPQLFGAFGANPNLVPEESEYWTIGINYGSAGSPFNVGVSYFDRDVDQRITFGLNPDTGEFGFNNLARQQDSGIELSADYQTDNWNISAAYIYLTGMSSDNDGNTTSEDLIRRPTSQFDFAINYSGINRLNLGVDFNFTGDRQDLFFDFTTFETNPVTLDSYSYVNFSAQYEINEAFEAYLNLQNAFDSEFEEVIGFSVLRQYVAVGVRFKVLN